MKQPPPSLPEQIVELFDGEDAQELLQRQAQLKLIAESKAVRAKHLRRGGDPSRPSQDVPTLLSAGEAPEQGEAGRRSQAHDLPVPAGGLTAVAVAKRLRRALSSKGSSVTQGADKGSEVLNSTGILDGGLNNSQVTDSIDDAINTRRLRILRDLVQNSSETLTQAEPKGLEAVHLFKPKSERNAKKPIIRRRRSEPPAFALPEEMECWPGKWYTNEELNAFFRRVWGQYIPLGLKLSDVKSKDITLWNSLRNHFKARLPWPEDLELLNERKELKAAEEVLAKGGIDQLSPAQIEAVARKRARDAARLNSNPTRPADENRRPSGATQSRLKSGARTHP